MPGAAVPVFGGPGVWGSGSPRLLPQLHVTRRRGERGGPSKFLEHYRLNADPQNSGLLGVWMARNDAPARVARPGEPASAFPCLRVSHCQAPFSATSAPPRDTPAEGFGWQTNGLGTQKRPEAVLSH